MSFKIFFHPKARRLFGKLGKAVKEQVRQKVSELKRFPKRGKPLQYSNFWSLRVGDYRVIYEIDETERRVIVLFVGHRRKVYDDFSKLF